MNTPRRENRSIAYPGLFPVLFRGARMQCPRCGDDTLYQRWNIFKNHCEACGYGFEDREGNCWFFLYSTTAALTGLFVILMLLWKPHDILLGRLVLGTASACVIALSLPMRKGIALALEFVTETRGGNLLLYKDSEQENKPE